MTEIVIRDGIVSSLTTQPTIVWDAIRNGDNAYGVFDGNNYTTWNDYSTSNTYNIVSYYDENHDMQIPRYYEWKSTFYDITSIPWSLYGLSYNSFLRYNGSNILFNSNNYALGAVIQLLPKTDSPFNSGSSIFSLITTSGNSNSDPYWIHTSLDYELSSISPIIHRFHFRVGREYATITINGSSFDITKPHVYSISGVPNQDNQFVYLYIDNKLVATLINASDISGAAGWTSNNSAIPNSFIIGGNVGLQLPQPYTTKEMGVYATFFYQNSYDYAQIFDLCKYRYNVPDVTFTPSVSYSTLNPPYVSVFGTTFNFGQYMSIL